MGRTATGIDVGSRTAIVLRGHPKGNTFAVTSFWAGPTSTGSVRECWSAVRPAFRLGGACVGLSGRGLNVRYTQVPRLKDWQLENLMRFEVGEIGGQSGSEMASDFNVLPELPEVEGEDVVLLAMAREELLAEHADGLAAAGGRLLAFTPNAVALYNAWLHYGVVEEDTVLVANIGHENVDVAIARGTDLLFARTLSGGSRLFDEAIAERFGISSERAEAAKAELASLDPSALHAGGNREKAARAVQGPAGQLLALLQSAILFCKTQIKLSGLSVERVALCGGGAALDGLDRFLEASLKVPVEVFEPFRVVDQTALSPAEAELLHEYGLESVAALGLATGASRDEAYKVEILPRRVARMREFWGKTALLVAAAVLCLAYLGYSAWKLAGDLETTRGEVTRLSSTFDRARTADLEARALLEENGKLAELVSELWLAAGSGEQIARTLEVFERELPRDFWLSEVSSRYASTEQRDRSDRRPVLHIEGLVREGTESPSALFEAFLARLAAELGNAHIVPGLSPAGDRFTIDMSLLVAEPRAGDDVGGEG